MNKILGFLLFTLLLVNCKSKKTSLQDEEDSVEVTDFIEFFPEIPLPVRIGDTTLNRKTTDSLLIGYKIFTQFIPDSILEKDFGKGIKPKLYPIGKTREKGKEFYLFIKAVSGAKRVGYLACFSKDEEYLSALPIVRVGFDRSTSAYGLLDNKFQITTYRERKAGNDFQFKRNVYIFNNSASSFTLIMTEPNEEIIENVINPIDTFQRKNKFSGDYVKDKRNFISVRDGRKTNELLFFVHFEKDNGNCVGELKGTIRFVSKTKAQYQEPGNPCALELNFAPTSISMIETGGCGSYRDIKCFFEGRYSKKSVPKPRSNPTKK